MEEFKLTQDQYNTILDAIKPISLIALHCGSIQTQQERANMIWSKLSKELGFDYLTVKPSPKGKLYFTASRIDNFADTYYEWT